MKKCIVVTGCSRGLGFAICRELVAHGYSIVGVSRTCSREFSLLMDESSGEVFFESFDFLSEESLYHFSKKITKLYGPVYGVVNNAAIGTEGVLMTMHDSDIDALFKVNVISPIKFTKYLLRSMARAKSGRVVNVSSVVGQTGYSGLSVYAATKGALNSFTKSLAREVGRLSITVNSIAPGFMETEMTSSISEQKLGTIRNRSPLKALPTVGDVSAMVVYLLSDSAERITGAVYTLDAGNTA